MCYTAENSEKHGHVWGDTYGRDGWTDRRMGDCYTQLSLVAQGSSKVANRPRRIPWLPVTLTTLLPIVLHFNLNFSNSQVTVRQKLLPNPDHTYAVTLFLFVNTRRLYLE